MAESDVLAERAARYHDEVMDVACGPGGILIAFRVSTLANRSKKA